MGLRGWRAESRALCAALVAFEDAAAAVVGGGGGGRGRCAHYGARAQSTGKRCERARSEPPSECRRGARAGAADSEQVERRAERRAGDERGDTGRGAREDRSDGGFRARRRGRCSADAAHAACVTPTGSPDRCRSAEGCGGHLRRGEHASVPDGAEYLALVLPSRRPLSRH